MIAPKEILAKELKISRQAVEKRRDKIKRIYGPMFDLEAYGVIGQTSLEKKDVAKILGLDNETLSRVRDVCFKIQNKGSEHVSSKPVPEKKPQTAARIIRIGGKADFKDPLLTQDILDDAKEMTDIYATLYVFENSVREVITRIMSEKSGKDWWNKLNGARAIKMRQDIKGRMTQEEKNGWHGKRGSHPLHYTDITNLIDIFEEYWADFRPYFPTFKWVEIRISEISMSRNVVDHHNPLKPNDQKRVQVYFTDWCNQIESIARNFTDKEEKP